MTIFSKILKAIDNPQRAVSVIKGKASSFGIEKEFTGSKKNRSASENGLYLASVKRSLKSYKSFSNFKKDPHYQTVLEHVSEKQGWDYLNFANEQTPKLLSDALRYVLINDEVGNPVKYDYAPFGKLSPTTLRYVKVASDLKVLFGDDLGKNVAEIGCGYGGQAITLDSLFKICRYTIYDLPLVNKLISKYLESFVMRGSYELSTLNQSQQVKFDLVISNYAFSELPSHIQKTYIQKVLGNAKKGYLTMNSGGDGSSTDGKLNIEDLRDLLPIFEVIEERPLTMQNNYIIVWGHKGAQS